LLSSRGSRINVVDSGSGPPVVLLHGLGCTASVWDAVVPGLAGYRTVRLDLRGFGGSDRPNGPFGLEDLADDVACVLDDLGLGATAVVGHSMGGMVAQHLALTSPSSVDRLVLCGTTGGLTPEIRRTTVGLRDLVRSQGSAALAAAMGPMVFAPRSQVDRPALVQDFVDHFGSCDPIVLALCLDAIAAFDVRRLLPRLSVPTTVIVGDQDPYLEDGRALAELVSGATLTVLAGTGHMTPVEAPDELAAAVAAALGVPTPVAAGQEDQHPLRRGPVSEEQGDSR
jgi:pimeloyl-ACP methyl ester carboxylesterase